MMLSSLMMTAGAADASTAPMTEADALSTYAGETVNAQAYVYDFSGELLLSVPYQANIPENATVAEEKDLTHAAAEIAVAEAMPATYSSRVSEPIMSKAQIMIPKKSGSSGTGGKYILGAVLNEDRAYYYDLTVKFYDISSEISQLNIRMTGDGAASKVTFDSVCQVNIPVPSSRDTSTVFVTNTVYNGDRFVAFGGDRIEVYASADQAGSAYTAELWGSYYD
ncbi:MAG: hypothetical protein Q3Y08_08180 [Butyricicoccus sp.]|nr:hypothetical protein [Butyricicoccus sp.]